MYNFKSKLFYGLVSLTYMFSASVVATTPSTASGLANKPLFLGGTAEPNILFDIDDSGSMDWEMLFQGLPSGLPRWNSTLQSFANDDGTFSTSGSRYAYNFPNGRNGSYDGRRLYGDGNQYYAMPPVNAYAFSRSADYNPGYYDPSALYTPWPSYGGFSFTDSSATAARFEPITTFTGAGTIDLTADRNRGGSDETFRIQSGMVCDNFGTTVCAGNAQISYYPATYYVKDTSATSSYTYNSGATPPPFDNSNSVLLELEDGDITWPMWFANDGSASGGGYIGTNDSESDFFSTPTSPGQSTVKFDMTGTANIWIRRWFRDGSHDSFWLNLKDHDSTDISVVIAGNTFTNDAGGQSWIQWWDEHSHIAAWVWEKVGTVNLSGSSHEFSVKLRESASYADVVLVTQNLTDTPDGILSLADPVVILPVTRTCDTVDPSHYKEFVASPVAFTGVDALAPDGSCLNKVEVRSSTSTYNSGTLYERTYANEIQNFANWFTFYRRRHQAMRGGLASALEGLSGIRTGMFWFNNRQNVTMDSFDSASLSSHVTGFMDSHYKRVTASGTPTRRSLDWAGYQYQRVDSSAPIIAECQRNYTLVFTDGFANDLPGNSAGNQDGATGEYSGVAPYTDGYDNTLADIAMKYYTTNLRPLENEGFSPVQEECDDTPLDPSLDCNKNLHMNTYAIGLNATGTLFGAADVNGDIKYQKVADAYADPPVWPNPTSSSGIEQADDFYHAAVNGRGEVFNASDPISLKTALKDAVTEIVESANKGSASSVAFNVSSSESNKQIITARFFAATWSGEIEAYKINASTGLLEESIWSVSSLLNDRADNPDSRYLLTYNGSDGVTFKWDNLTTSQKADLNTSPSGTVDSNGSQRLEFIRGDRSMEGSIFRTRTDLLGDIVHSSPIYVGPPSMNYPDVAPFGSSTSRYSSFKTAQKDRTEVVYAGANDGMLHGFLTADALGKVAGSEIFGYVPNALYSTTATAGLHYLTDPNYSHINYVDGPSTVADAYISGAWKTLLVGSLRGGGKGIYALDVTNPANFVDANAASQVLWEFTSADDSSVGHIVEKPILAMMNNNKWAVVFGNGYGGSSTKLFIVYVEAGLDGTWSTSDYKVIDTEFSSGGLSEPTLADLDDDGVVDRIYAGDLGGNMWAFDVSQSSDSSWDSVYTSGGDPVPLFSAVNGTTQPITSAPALAINPNVSTSDSNLPNVLVLFGSGQYLVGGDVGNTDEQSFYAIWDHGSSSLTRSNLEPRTINNVSSNQYRTTTGNNVDWTGTTPQHGWYIDFDVVTDQGERVITSATVRDETVFFNTIIPSSSGALCVPSGRGYLMSVGLRDGLTPSEPAFDNNGDGKVDESDTAYSGVLSNQLPWESTFRDDKRYTSDSTGEIEVAPVMGLRNRDGRLSWLEIFSD